MKISVATETAGKLERPVIIWFILKQIFLNLLVLVSGFKHCMFCNDSGDSIFVLARRKLPC